MTSGDFRSLLGAALLFWPVVGCAQAREPARALEIPTQSRASRSQREVRADVHEVLARRGDASSLREAGPDAVVALEQVLHSAAEPRQRRERAVEVLGILEEPAAGDRLRALVKTERTAAFLRGAAAVALAHRFGAQAFEDLKPLLQDDASEVRVGAARAMVVIATKDARTAVEQRVSSEGDRDVREALQHNLSRMNP